MCFWLGMDVGTCCVCAPHGVSHELPAKIASREIVLEYCCMESYCITFAMKQEDASSMRIAKPDPPSQQPDSFGPSWKFRVTIA